MIEAPASLRSCALLITALVFTAAGCSSTTKTPTSETSQSSTPSPSETATPTEERKPAQSEAAVYAGLSRKDMVTQEISGIVAWEVQPGKGLTPAVAKKIEVVADAFLAEHMLRSDRWTSKYAVKSGEMDVVREKYTKSLFDLTSADIDWFDSNQKKYGKNYEDWPKKQQGQRTNHIQGMGALFVTTLLADGGTGPVRNEMKRKVVYPGSDPGEILAYTEVTGRRANNTGGTKSVTIKQTFVKVDGQWLIDGVYWSLD